MFVALAATMTIVVFAGFAPTFYLLPWTDADAKAPFEPVIYLHGAVFTGWMVLLVVQPILTATGRFDLHRRLGWFGAILAAGVVITGFAAALEAAARPVGSALPPKDPAFLGVILAGIVLFGMLVTCAVLLRRRGPYHKRLMMLATVNLLQAAVVRLPVDFPGSFGAATTFWYACLFVMPLVAWDLARLRRIHPATLWGGLTVVGSVPLRFWLSETGWWLATADWLVRQVP